MLNHNLTPSHIDLLITNINLANCDTEYRLNISSTIKADIFVDNHNISISLTTGNTETANIKYRIKNKYESEPKLEFDTMTSTSGNGSPTSCYSLNENIIAYREKAEALIAMTLIGGSMERLKGVMEDKLLKRRIAEEKLEAERKAESDAELERANQAHMNALKDFQSKNNIITDENQAFQLLTRLKKGMVEPKHKYNIFFLKHNAVTISSISFEIVKTGSKTEFLSNLSKKISQKNLAKSLVNCTVKEA